MDCPLHLYRWRVADPIRPGRRYVTRHHLSAEDAKALDRNAERVDWSEMVIKGPTVPHSTPPNRQYAEQRAGEEVAATRTP